MQPTSMPKDIDRLLAEADELIRQIDSNTIKDMEEEDRIQFKTHVQSLRKRRSELQQKIDKEGIAESGTYSEGMHKAIDEIMAAIRNLASYRL